jgi:hypothetical protein
MSEDWSDNIIFFPGYASREWPYLDK